MRELTREERAAMWLYHDEYAAKGGGAIEFYANLPTWRKNAVRLMLDEL